MRVGYKRVSTLDQNTARQLEGVEVERMFEEHASGRTIERPILSECIAFVRSGDTLVVHSLDRVARNLQGLLTLVQALDAKGVTLECVKERLTFTPGAKDPMSQLMLSIFGAVAEFERGMIRERQREGIALAKTRGLYKGGVPKLTDMQAAELRIRAALPGANKAALAREYKISRETLYRYL